MRRPVVLAACFALLLAPSAPASRIGDRGTRKHSTGVPAKSWAQPEIKLVVAHKLMAKSVAAFRANDALAQGELAALVAGLTKQTVKPAADPGAAVTVTQLDARLVKAMQLSDAAATVLMGARDAGLNVPAPFGTEAIARLLGLRTNHPAKDDD